MAGHRDFFFFLEKVNNVIVDLISRFWMCWQRRFSGEMHWVVSMVWVIRQSRVPGNNRRTTQLAKPQTVHKSICWELTTRFKIRGYLTRFQWSGCHGLVFLAGTYLLSIRKYLTTLDWFQGDRRARAGRRVPGIKKGKCLLSQPVMVPDARDVSRGTVNEGLCFRSL